YQEFCGLRQTAPAGDAIDAVGLKRKIDRGEDFVLIDVREPHEYQIGRIPGSKLIPLGELPKHLNELDPNAEYIMQCKTGARSQKATDLLKQHGFKHVLNMTGGITAWSDKVDPSVPKY
ncbi:MAG: rhodanese-like domain-containing protein, partial [Terriglobia bacterium]